MANDYDDEADPTDPRFPGGAIAAGIIWIAFGGLGLLGIGMNLISLAVMGAQNGPNLGPPQLGRQAGPMACAFGCVGLIAAVFLYVGIQTVRGAARDTLGNGIGSIVLSLPAYGFAAMGVFMGVVGVGVGGPAGGGGAAPANIMVAAAVVVAVVYGLAGTALLAAGIMALYARGSYLAWRASRGMGRPRRRQLDEGDGDEPGDPRSEGRP